MDMEFPKFWKKNQTYVPEDKLGDHARELHKCIKEKRYEDGLKLLDSVFNKNAESDWYNKGNFLANLHRIDEAIECYTHAILLDNEYVKAWYRKGNNLLVKCIWVEAAKCFENVIKIETNNVNRKHGKEEWAAAALFSCMISCVSGYNDCVINKKPMPDFIRLKTDYWIEKTREFLESNQIIPKFDDETKFIDYCHLNYEKILDKLEPNIAIEIRYDCLKFFKTNKGSIKIYESERD